MGAWNFTPCLILIVAFLNNVQALEAIPNGNCSHGLQWETLQCLLKVAPEATEEDALVSIDFFECASKWLATIGELCISNTEFDDELQQLARTYRDDIPWSEFKALAIQKCHNDLKCTAARECEWKYSSLDSSTCDLSETPKEKLVPNCDKEIQAFVNLGRRLL